MNRKLTLIDGSSVTNTVRVKVRSTLTHPYDSPFLPMTEPKSRLKKITDVTDIEFGFHDLRRTFATHAEANGVPFDLIRRALNHKSRSVTEGYIITQIDTLRPVFDAVADGYHRYYDPSWEHEALIGQTEGEETGQEAEEEAG